MTTDRSASTPYVRGLSVTRIVIQRGRPSSGNMAPERKNIGSVRKFMITVNPCIDRMREAAAMPMAVSENEIYSRSGSSAAAAAQEKWISRNGAKSNIRQTWSMATVLPPKVLPTATAAREIGATMTSFKNPISRSQIIEMAENTEVNSKVIAMMPG